MNVTITQESLVASVNEKIESLNQQVQDGNLEVQDDGQLVSTGDTNFYVQGGSTKNVTYWWGVAEYKSTAAANTLAYKLNNAAIYNGVGAAVSGALGFAPGVALCTISGAYSAKLANDISYVNSRTSRGIVLNVTWVLAYSIRTQ